MTPCLQISGNQCGGKSWLHVKKLAKGGENHRSSSDSRGHAHVYIRHGAGQF